MLDVSYHRLNNFAVRDLYWLLFRDSPLSDSFDLSPYSLFPQSIIEEWKILSVDYFKELDKNPETLIAFLDRKKNKRLGFYAEALLSYFFQTFKQVDLLLQNFQIIEGQKTIGETDFIIRYKGKVIHLECAVKYYLLNDPKHPNDALNWVGPRRKDNLGLKIDRLLQHQLPLSERKEVQYKINCTIDNTYLFFKGIFFSEKKIDSRNVNRNQPNQFVLQSELKNLSTQAICILTRPNWLSATHPSANEHQHDLLELNSRLMNPEMVLFDDKKTTFVVPDEWGRSH